MKNCDIVKDLLPLHADGLASDESEGFISAHMAECAECRSLMERMCAPEQPTESEADYRPALKTQRRRTLRRALIIGAAALLLGAAVCVAVLASQGYFNIASRLPSPDGTKTATAYEGYYMSARRDGALTVSIVDNGVESAIVFGDSAFRLMSWSPDSRYLVISITTDGRDEIHLDDRTAHSGKDVNNLLNAALLEHEFFAEAELDSEGRAMLTYSVFRWSDDGAKLLLSWHLTEKDAADPSGTRILNGTLAYDPLTDAVSDIVYFDESESGSRTEVPIA